MAVSATLVLFILKTFLQDVLKMSWRCLEDVLKTSWKRLEDVLAIRLKDVLKTSWRSYKDVWPRWKYWSWPRRLEDVFWRRMTKVNIFVLVKSSWRRLEGVFWWRSQKTSSRRLHQDKCLLGSFMCILYNNSRYIQFIKKDLIHK